MTIIKDVHMKAAMWGAFFLGLGHVKFSKELYTKIYTTYKYSVLIFFMCFVLSEFLELPVSYKSRNYSSLMDNLAVFLLYTSSSAKFFVLMGENISLLVIQVRTVEKIILDSADKTMKIIFEKYRIYNQRLSILILFLGAFTILLWFLNPVFNYFDYLYFQEPTNATYERALIFSSWFPFDRKKYYWAAYFFQFFSGLYGASITVVPDAFLWSFMTFALMNIGILKYKLQNIPAHVKETMSYNSWMNEKQAYRVVLNKCIFLHKSIITLVGNLDKAMNLLMLADFAVCSVQMGACAMRILVFNTSRLLLFSSAEYLAGILTQMMLFYWHANEILLESENISMAIYTSDWYNFDNQIKMDLKFMMMRAQRPLLLNIGPFYYMSTAAAIGIMKAAYSYIALMRQFYS